MYAIIADSGRQFRVEPGQILDIDYRDASTTDDTLTFDRVLAVGSDTGLRLGSPTVAGASVTAKVLGVEKGDKIYIQKFRRRKNYDRRTGHRQLYTRVRIDSINGLAKPIRSPPPNAGRGPKRKGPLFFGSSGMILAQVDQLLAFTLLVLNQMVPGLEKNVRALEH